MTPGRRRFTIGHEFAHALFHSDDGPWVVSYGRSPRETFADEFAGEFLMPSEGVRRFQEEAGLPPRLTDPVDVIHLQRFFQLSWPTALVRLRQMKAITNDSYNAMKKGVRPVALARSLGYTIHPEEYEQDAESWRVRRMPRLFLRMLRQAVVSQLMSVPTAAAFAGLAIPDITQILGQPTEDEGPEQNWTEFGEFEETGVLQ